MMTWDSACLTRVFKLQFLLALCPIRILFETICFDEITGFLVVPLSLSLCYDVIPWSSLFSLL